MYNCSSEHDKVHNHVYLSRQMARGIGKGVKEYLLILAI